MIMCSKSSTYHDVNALATHHGQVAIREPRYCVDSVGRVKFACSPLFYVQSIRMSTIRANGTHFCCPDMQTLLPDRSQILAVWGPQKSSVRFWKRGQPIEILFEVPKLRQLVVETCCKPFSIWSEADIGYKGDVVLGWGADHYLYLGHAQPLPAVQE